MKKVLVLGSVNNLPTMYAHELALQKAELILVSGFLKRHELHDPKKFFMNQKVPDNLKLKRLPFFNHFLLPFYSFLYFLLMKLFIIRNWKPDVVIFNDSYISLSKFFPKAFKVFLPHGGDIETWCGFTDIDNTGLANSMKKASLFKYVPSAYIRKHLITFIRKKYTDGLNHCDVLIYFPESFTEITRNIKKYCVKNGIEYWERYDLSLKPILKYSADDKRKFRNRAFEIIVPVRFAFKTFGEGNKIFNKSNDLILLGIDEFIKQHESQEVMVTLFEKGADLEEAKKIVANCEFLKDRAVWIKPVSLDDLIERIFESDFCFDGVGDHWPGAVAGYSLCLGVPTAANFEKVKSILPQNVDYLYDVKNTKEIVDALNDAFINKKKRVIQQVVLDEFRSIYSTENMVRKILVNL